MKGLDLLATVHLDVVALRLQRLHTRLHVKSHIVLINLTCCSAKCWLCRMSSLYELYEKDGIMTLCTMDDWPIWMERRITLNPSLVPSFIWWLDNMACATIYSSQPLIWAVLDNIANKSSHVQVYVRRRRLNKSLRWTGIIDGYSGCVWYSNEAQKWLAYDSPRGTRLYDEGSFHSIS